jgi:uncharacterized protein (TIGR04255 family)
LESRIDDMGTQRHYMRAPITEAIISLGVKPAESVTLANIERCGAEQPGYPNKKSIIVSTGQFQIGEGISASTTAQQVGFLFSSTDQKLVFQVRPDGFALSRLAPYENWERFRNEARRLWNVYREIARPERLARLAVRYINRFDLPLPLVDFKDFLTTIPEVAPRLPQGLAGFFMQLNIPQVDKKAVLLLSETIIEPAHPDVVSIVLDIDLVRTDDLPTEEEAIWFFMDELRVRKNEVFEACITDRTRELIN